MALYKISFTLISLYIIWFIKVWLIFTLFLLGIKIYFIRILKFDLILLFFIIFLLFRKWYSLL